MEQMNQLLMEQGVGAGLAKALSGVSIAVLILLMCLLANLIIKKVVLKILASYIRSNRFHWDDVLLEKKVFHKLLNIAPAIIIYVSAPIFEPYRELIQKAAATYIFILAIVIINAVLRSVEEIYKTFSISKIRPIKGLVQIVKIIVYITIGIAIIANLMGENPLILLSGIGALAAVFSFVFKDSILGFVAGIQLTANDMLRIGDWIEMTKYGADGDIIDISLNTVKVQNFDKTIVTIPAYALVSDSFINWRGMQEAGGRRIKRSLHIDMSSIGFCTQEMIETFKKIHYLTDYILKKEEEIEQYNLEHEVDDKLLINGRQLTNIGTFRVYIQNYLNNHPKIHQSMIQMVRQMPPTAQGLPLEIYVFTSDTEWVNYEGVQADIFDHILAVAHVFELRVFQNPTGYDLKQISGFISEKMREKA